MKKYWIVFTTVFSNISTYRIEIILNIIQSFIVPTFMMLALSQAKSTSISMSELVPYLLLVSTLLPIYRSNIDQHMGELSHSGDINNFLTRPLSLYRYLLAQEASKKISTLIILCPLLVIIFIFFQYTPNVLTIIISLILSFLVSFNLNYLFGLSTFWFDDFWVLRNINDVMLVLLGGAILPYTFFPNWAIFLIKLTPFPYIVSLPTRLIQGTAHAQELLGMVFWIFILFLIRLFIEKKAIEKYSFVSN